jgi:hypothetical protein
VQLRALLALQPDCPVVLLLKGQLDVLRQQPKKALRSVAPLLAAGSQACVRWVACGGKLAWQRGCKYRCTRKRSLPRPGKRASRD